MNETEKDQLLNDIINDETQITSAIRKPLQEHLKYKVGIISNVFVDPINFFTEYILNRTKANLNFREEQIKQMLEALTDPNNETKLRTGNTELDRAIEKSFSVMLKYTITSKVQQKFIDFLEEENKSLKQKLSEINARRKKRRN